jgi:Cu/Ag efflux pump CusA
VTYPIALQTPQYQIDTLPALQNLPINASGAPTTVLGGIADIRRSHSDAVVSQYDIQPMVQIYATTQGRDLGAVAATSRRSSPRTTRTSRRARSSPWSARPRP